MTTSGRSDGRDGRPGDFAQPVADLSPAEIHDLALILSTIRDWCVTRNHPRLADAMSDLMCMTLDARDQAILDARRIETMVRYGFDPDAFPIPEATIEPDNE